MLMKELIASGATDLMRFVVVTERDSAPHQAATPTSTQR